MAEMVRNGLCPGITACEREVRRYSEEGCGGRRACAAMKKVSLSAVELAAFQALQLERSPAHGAAGAAGGGGGAGGGGAGGVSFAQAYAKYVAEGQGVIDRDAELRPEANPAYQEQRYSSADCASSTPDDGDDEQTEDSSLVRALENMYNDPVRRAQLERQNSKHKNVTEKKKSSLANAQQVQDMVSPADQNALHHVASLKEAIPELVPMLSAKSQGTDAQGKDVLSTKGRSKSLYARASMSKSRSAAQFKVPDQAAARENDDGLQRPTLTMDQLAEPNEHPRALESADDKELFASVATRLLGQEPKCSVRAEFRMEKRVPYGSVLVVVGSAPALGSWDRFNALRLKWHADDVWSQSVDVGVGEARELVLEYKYVIRPANDKQALDKETWTWEPGPNHVVCVADTLSGITCHDKWDMERRSSVKKGVLLGASSAMSPAALYKDNPDRINPFSRESSTALLSRQPFEKGTVRFSVNYKTSYGDNVYVCGSVPELGQWNKQKAKRMQFVKGSTDTWRLDVAIPASTLQFEYKYFVWKAQGERQWEVGFNTNRLCMPWLKQVRANQSDMSASLLDAGRKLSSEAGSAVMACMNDRWESHKVVFSIYYPTKPNEAMCVTGDLAEIGGWFMPGPVAMHLGEPEILETDVIGRKWYLEIYLPYTTRKFEYRYVIMNSLDGSAVWEREPNRRADLDSHGVTINSTVQLKDVNFVGGMQFDYVPDNLFIGPYPQSREDIAQLKEAGVTAVINTQTDEDFRHRQIEWSKLVAWYQELGVLIVRVPIQDFNRESLRQHLHDAATKMRELIDAGHQVFVHCTAGMGRAPAVAVAYLCFQRGWQLQHAVDHVKYHRTVAAPNVPLIQEMIDQRNGK
ncbi:Phosphoglucan phosphatase LSF2, chloroplastic [Porphyridium purpureum]|uniref:Phosphoglucan phosphatase LSF2, chloroplastic n=1 Tax=Porphyridium purpureum TaxID=35688 RepID=A0A5J4YUA6_PORPP|nr:Phosphoglucan phosphatase LSF2, chloroplastic [Porphyridium purpureum]|eukprot:POR4150..scf229_5